jgi:hypothetical protein
MTSGRCCAVWAAALFVVTLSLGESFWSPRWYDYSMSLAPHGREGIFTALASAPLFAAKLPTGVHPPVLRLMISAQQLVMPSLCRRVGKFPLLYRKCNMLCRLW